MVTLVPTPIGNLEDISFRSLEVLKKAQIIFCEDTRVTKKLLKLLTNKYSINFSYEKIISFHSHNEYNILRTIDKDILKQKDVIYLSDAGMPCISDPGSSLIQYCITHNISYDALPGANALLTAFCMSGFQETTFSFFGFLPKDGKKRSEMLIKALNNEHITILYESPHRLIKLLEELNKLDTNRIIFLVKELTKLYQKIFKNSVSILYEELKTTNIKGEWVVILDSKEKIGIPLELNDIEELNIKPKEKAKLISKLTGRKIKDIYQELLDKIEL